MLLAGLPADVGVAAAAFVGTNTDNALVTLAMVAAAPPERARRVATGQILGFVALVIASGATAIALFEISPRVVGLLGLVPLTLGLRGLLMMRRHEQRDVTKRAVGAGIISAALVTIGAGGDNLAVYIPLFRLAGVASIVSITCVFALGEALLTVFVLRVGQYDRVRRAVTRIGTVGAPLLYCCIGVLVLLRAGTI
jgi:cadmium resistance protein CadD (predicted permease)